MVTGLNKAMLNYATCGRTSKVAHCLYSGADVNTENGQILQIAIWNNQERLFSLALKFKIRDNLENSLNLAIRLNRVWMIEELHEYMDKHLK